MARKRATQNGELFIDAEDLSVGLTALEDTTKAKFGASRIMKNCYITDRGGIAPRPGTSILGTKDTATDGIKGFYNFRKSFDSNEILLKGKGTQLLAYSKNHSGAGWFVIKDSFTDGKEFGFVTSLVNTDNEDYTIFCNRFENYMRWSGAVSQLNGALSGGESAITVDSTLTDEIFESQTATSSSATSLTVSTANWATSQWVNLYVHIVGTGKVRKITSNNGTSITFDTLGSDPGSVAFQIRKLAFPATGTIIYGGTEIVYTGIDLATTFTVSSAHAGADNAGVAIIPTEYPDNPKGNKFANYLARIVVGDVRSGLTLDSGGNTQAFAVEGSVFVSQQKDPVDFTFQATRVAGEGDIIGTPYGGGAVTDVVQQEDQFYIFKKRYIEADSYTQDANDLIQREPLKAEVGSVGSTIKGPNDVYFITDDNEFTSLGRVISRDITPATQNIGIKIKRILLDYIFGEGSGIYHENRIFIPAKENSTDTSNNSVLIYNAERDAFEGIWSLSAFAFDKFNGDLYYAESNGNNVFKMFDGHADYDGTTRFPISAEYATHYFNLSTSKNDLQSLGSLYFEGYITTNSTITFNAFKDFGDDPFLTFDFTGSEDAFTEGKELSAFLGSQPLGLRPLGAIGAIGEDGRRPFYFRVYFPYQYGRYFSVGFNFDELDGDVELTRFGLGLAKSVSSDANKVKSV